MGVARDADVRGPEGEDHGLAAQHRAILMQVIEEACVQLLDAYSVPVRHVAEGRIAVPADLHDPCAGAASADHPLFGTVGFTGQIRGCLTVIASAGLLGSTFPTIAGGVAAPSHPELLDWAGEMANQTLGRIKRLFCRRGVDFEASTPTVGDACEMTQAPSPGASKVGLVLTSRGEHGLMSVGFEVVPRNDGTIFDDPSVPIDCAPEGDLVLF